MIYCLFDNIFISVARKMSSYDQDPAGSVINFPSGPKDYGSANPYLDPTEIYLTRNTGIMLPKYRYRMYKLMQCCGSMTFWCGSGSADPCL
jgi:hypothetical protein